MSRIPVEERIRQLRQAAEGEPRELVTANSPQSVRNNSGQGLATVPYLTIGDIIQLKAAGYEDLEAIEDRILEVPDRAWDHVVHLVEARVLEVPLGDLEAKATAKAEAAEEEGTPRCLAFTKAGNRCRNLSREGSKYCASHKGYRPSKEELEARESGLIAQ